MSDYAKAPRKDYLDVTFSGQSGGQRLALFTRAYYNRMLVHALDLRASCFPERQTPCTVEPADFVPRAWHAMLH